VSRHSGRLPIEIDFGEISQNAETEKEREEGWESTLFKGGCSVRKPKKKTQARNGIFKSKGKEILIETCYSFDSFHEPAETKIIINQG